MSKVLYRKFRPQDFDSLIGQEHVAKALRSAIQNDMVSHAYLFTGSRGTGKTSTARIFAKALNCTALTKEGNPCNSCEACVSINDGNFLDLIEIDAASNRGINEIREIKERLEFLPVSGRYKIYIIDEVHMLTTEAFNALLKTLEEPPAHVIFILATTDAHKLPPTILSRCQRYDFHLASRENIIKHITEKAEAEKLKLDKDALEVIAQSANGSYRDALSLLDVVLNGASADQNKDGKISAEEIRKLLGLPDALLVTNFLNALFTCEAAGLVNMIVDMEARGINSAQFVKNTLQVLRELIVSMMTNSDSLKSYEYMKNVTLADLLKVTNLFINADKNMKNASNPTLLLELLVAEFIVFKTAAPVERSESNTAEKIAPSPEAKPASEAKPVLDQKVHETIKESEKVKAEIPAPVEASSPVEVKSDGVVEIKIEDLPPTVVAEVPVAEVAAVIVEEVGDEQVEAAKSQGAVGPINFDEVTKHWGTFLNEIKGFHAGLYTFFKNARVAELNADQIKLEVAFAFHKSKIEDPKIKDHVTELVSKVYGQALKIECVVNEAAKSKKLSSADVVLAKLPPKAEEKKPEGNGFDYASRKADTKKIEAIFDGL